MKPNDEGAPKLQPFGGAGPRGPRPLGPRPLAQGGFADMAKSLPGQNGVPGRPKAPGGPLAPPGRPLGPGPQNQVGPGSRPILRPAPGQAPAKPLQGLQRLPQQGPGAPQQAQQLGPRGITPGQSSQPAFPQMPQAVRGPPLRPGPAGPGGPPNSGPAFQPQSSPAGPPGFQAPQPSQGPQSTYYQPKSQPGPSFARPGPPQSRPSIPGSNGQPGLPPGPAPPSQPTFGAAPTFGAPGMPGAPAGTGFSQPPGSLGMQSTKQLEPYESVPVNPTNMPGQAPANIFELLPRPLEEGDEAIKAPPLAHARNCESRYVRVTVSAIPSQQSMRARYQLPIGAIVHPLADPQDIPIVNPDVHGIIRCRRCRTYINPFVTWQDNGRRFVCNVCAMTNEVPVEYYSPLDHDYQRQDLEQRPELRSGSVEYIAPQEYMVRAPMPPVFFFVIDVSVTAVNSGMVATTCAAIKDSLDSLPGGDRTRIGFLTYDNHLHFYNLKSSLSQPQMMVVAEIDDPFPPQPDDLIVNLQESRGVVETLLSTLPQLFSQNLSSDSAMGPALQAAFLAMSSLGGKMLLFQAAVPSLGIGKIKQRENPSMWNTDQEYKLRIPDDSFWKQFAAECSRQQIAVDVFSFSREYTDLASIGALPKYTCGQLYSYPSFTREKDGVKLSHEIVHNLTRTTGWEAVMRIRCSKGLRVSGFHGHFFVRSTDLLALPQVDPDKAFAVQIAHEESVVSSKVAYIQCALLYTSSSGERRIRVHTLMLPVVNEVADLYRTADGPAVATLIAKLAMEKTYQAKLEESRNAIQNKLVVAFKEYRSLYSAQAMQQRNALPVQLLIYPPSLRYLPLWILGLLKSAAVRGGARDVVLDERITVGLDLMSASVPTLLRMLYPPLYAVSDRQGNWGRPQEDGTIALPPRAPLCSEVLYPQKAYLLDNGRIFLLWLGRDISDDFMSEVFGVNSAAKSPDQAPSLVVEPARRGYELSERINAVVSHLRKGRPIYQKCFTIRQGSPQEHHVLPYFVEDRVAGHYGYPDFIQNIHRQVLSK